MHAGIMNDRIEQELARATGIALKEPSLTPDQVKERLRLPEARGKTFTELARLDLKETPPDSWHTMKQRGQLIERFDKFAPGVAVGDVNSALLERFRAAMLRRGVSSNSAASNLRRLRTIYNRVCERAGVPPLPVLKGLKATERYNSPKATLNAAEIASLERYAKKAQGWNAKAVDMWLFSFYCAGIRWGDLCRLTVGNIVDGQLSYKQWKSDELKVVWLSDGAKAIAKKYVDGKMLFGVEGSKMPAYQRIAGANVKANAALKVAAKACGITKVLSTHTSRHSFMRAGLLAGVSDRGLQQLMGIGDKSFKNYRGSFTLDELSDQHKRILKRKR